MRRIVYSLLLISVCVPAILFSQTVTGKMIDHNGAALPGLNLQLHIQNSVYSTTSGSDGTFTFNGIVLGIEDEDNLPSGYAVSNNYPNPFNPKTRIGFALPTDGQVKINIYNSIGQRVVEEIEKNCGKGNNYIDLELNGLPNGLYIARIAIDGKFTVVRKLMLVYGSNHLSETASIPNFGLNRALKKGGAALATAIDSLVAGSPIIGRKVFKNLQSITENNLNLGNLTVNRFWEGLPTVVYEGKTYNTIQIGTQCWLKENLDVGTMILNTDSPSNNGVIEKYCYNNDPNNCTLYGAYYQWNEAMQYVTTSGARGICPPGFHIPTYEEFQTLQSLINNNDTMLKGIGQGTGIYAGNNLTGFSAILAGGRNYQGPFADLGAMMYMWTSSTNTDGGSHFVYLVGNAPGLNFSSYDRRSGFSIRCIKD